MSLENNSSIIKKMQQYLKEYGHKVKTGHLYEIFSKLSGEKSWNVAKSKNVSFQNIINPENAPKSEKREYIKMLWNKELRRIGQNELLFGYSLEKRIILKKEFTKFSHSLFVGAMGTGKTNAQISTLISFMKNPNSTAYICDVIKGAIDYEPLFSDKRIIPVLNDSQKLIKTIDTVYLELKKRLDLFDKEGVYNLEEYKNKTNIVLNNILLVFEEFDYICRDFLMKDEKLTELGEKIRTIMRTGRSLGIWISASAQKAMPNDIPNTILVGFSNRYVFKTSSAEAELIVSGSSLLIKDISNDDRGVCVGDEGKIQFPYVLDSL